MESPIIVFSDCDLDKAADAVINGFTDNAGQCCIATSRLVVDDAIYGKLKEKIIRKLNEKNFQQSLATDDQFNKVKVAEKGDYCEKLTLQSEKVPAAHRSRCRKRRIPVHQIEPLRWKTVVRNLGPLGTRCE